MRLRIIIETNDGKAWEEILCPNMDGSWLWKTDAPDGLPLPDRPGCALRSLFIHCTVQDPVREKEEERERAERDAQEAEDMSRLRLLDLDAQPSEN
jgi:hypothetical protein